MWEKTFQDAFREQKKFCKTGSKDVNMNAFSNWPEARDVILALSMGNPPKSNGMKIESCFKTNKPADIV